MSRRGGAPAVDDAGQPAGEAGPDGPRSPFEPPEPAVTGRPDAEPPHTGAPHGPHTTPGYPGTPPADGPPYSGTPPAQAPYPETPPAGSPLTEAPPADEPPYAETPPAGPAFADPPDVAPTEAAESPGSRAADPPGRGSPYDTTPGAPAGAASEPRALFAAPVDQLGAVRRGDHLLVVWAWPEDALSARVRWRREGGTGGAGPGDGDVVCRRRVYEHDGGFDLAVGREAVVLTVEALVPELPEGCEGASSLLVPAAPAVVAYEPVVRRRLKGRIAAVTFTSDTGCDLPGLRIVHGLGRFRPTSTAEGTVLHEVPAQRLSAGAPMTVEFPLPATRGPSWLVCFPADAGTDSGIDIRPTALHRLRVT